MSNVATLDMNVTTLLGFPTTRKFQKSNLLDFYTLPSCSFFILTILDHLMTIYNKNNTGSKPFHTKNLIFENFEKHGYQKPKIVNNKPILMHTRLSDTTARVSWVATLTSTRGNTKNNPNKNLFKDP